MTSSGSFMWRHQDTPGLFIQGVTYSDAAACLQGWFWIDIWQNVHKVLILLQLKGASFAPD